MKKPILLIIILCIITRLPMLCSPHFMLDYDECVVALMAKHWHDGAAFPYWFYGQHYGFTFVETSVIALSYTFGGITDYAVKLPMLALWIAGIIFFYKALKNITSEYKYIALLITIIFIFSPAWALWSMKARGGYLTAFLFSSLIIWLLFNPKIKNQHLQFATVGLFSVIIYYSQPLWLPGTAVFIIFGLYTYRNYRYLLSTAAGTIAGLLLFDIIRKYSTNYAVNFWWHPDVFNLNTNILTELQHLPHQLYTHFCGSYYLTNIFTPTSIAIKIFAGAFAVMLVLMLVASAYLIISKNKPLNKMVILSGISVLLTIGCYLFTTDHAPRYLLPVTGFSLMLAVEMMLELTNPKVVIGITTFFILTGSIAMYSFKDYTFDESNKPELKNMISYLEKNKIHATYSCDWLLQWHVMFYSQEDIIARYTAPADRYPKYIKTVNDAYARDARHTAIIGFANQLPVGKNTISFGNTYFVYPNPSAQLLDSLGFKMK